MSYDINISGVRQAIILDMSKNGALAIDVAAGDVDPNLFPSSAEILSLS